ENLPPISESKPLPEGPFVQETRGEIAALRTYQDLLKNPYDEKLFEYYVTASILKIGLDGSRQPFLPPAMYQNLSYSPDGKYILVSTIQKPFSYNVPYSYFSIKYSIHSSSGEFLNDFYLRPVVEDVLPMFDACEKGRRAIQWRNDRPAELCWVEALDNGDPRIETNARDAIFLQNADFKTPSVKIATTLYRFSGIIWANDQLAVLKEYWYKNRRSLTSFISPAFPMSDKKIVFDLSSEDLYADPGDFLTQRNEFNEWILRFSANNKYLYLEGEGYSPEGNRPFLDEFDVSTFSKRRLWQAEGKSNYESIVRVVDPKQPTMITTIESKYEVPNLFMRTGKKLRQLTFFTSPYGELQSKIKSEKIFYKRNDGTELLGTLYLPATYDPVKEGPLPLLMWAYPREYKDAQRAGQVKDSPHQFVRFHYGSPVFWALRGYAVLDEASFPIIGENAAQPNDTFIEQLVEDARAAIDYLAKRGIVDHERVAIGGHSYGAFMVANLLAHSDLFAAGIARSGAYNRTLTPFGFQSEERTFWEAPEVYLKMSPFVYADRIKSPLLLIHGEADNNSGTFTLQSERLFAAINGLGGKARLVILPYESHGYSARENILHTLWETDVWLEKYLKNKEMESTPRPIQE
nr:prolyl oligopeptidase family serine peptidase [Bacteroidales bacterium]